MDHKGVLLWDNAEHALGWPCRDKPIPWFDVTNSLFQKGLQGNGPQESLSSSHKQGLREFPQRSMSTINSF